ncbi:FadR/GntR family transcriptional regulator [Piscinibacter sp. XHJ-5]|uniref:FadR/GntR family transcriptional regulator n=1 Tax=Piscinibacter sp. XHJ-5 TaxID=3037797 RepID=UPI00245340B9|nr:FadR/GntR family transcriptional regulator [Piscinibacter sp. XHJ-5]
MKPLRAIASTYSGRNLHGQVVHELGRRIVGGTCPPGQALPNEEELCRELGVSRTALRESVKVLAAKGLVESRPRIGTRVRANEDWNMLDPDVLAWRCATLPDAHFVLQLNEMREIIEPASAALAARNRTPTQLRDIEDAFEAMAAAQNIDQWVDADLHFHSAILDATNNPLLRPLGAMIGTALESLLGLSARKAGNFKVALPDHGRVLEAIRTQDGEAARQRMASLLADTRARLLKPTPRQRARSTAARTRA